MLSQKNWQLRCEWGIRELEHLMNLRAADHETRQRERVSPATKLSPVLTFMVKRWPWTSVLSHLAVWWLSDSPFSKIPPQGFSMQKHWCSRTHAVQFHCLFEVFSKFDVVNVTSIQMLHPEGVCPGAAGKVLDQHGWRPPAVSVHDADSARDQRLRRH